MDVLTQQQRRKTMAAVKGKNTACEIDVRKLLHEAGFRFRLHRRDLPGNPDIVLSKYRTVIFVHGCFWHQHQGCRASKRPSSRTEYWEAKLNRNMERDSLNVSRLRSLGWRVVVIWECETKDKQTLLMKLKQEICIDQKEKKPA